METRLEPYSPTSTAVGTVPTVRDLMTPEVFTLNENDDLNLLQEMMRWKRIRHVPVVNDDGELVGIVTHRDFLRVAISRLAEVEARELNEIYHGITLSHIMNPEVRVIHPEASLAEAAKVMRENKYGCLPVVDEGRRLAGILTEADFLKAFEEWDAVFSR
jgi:CBS domain-containing membrane protein